MLPGPTNTITTFSLPTHVTKAAETEPPLFWEAGGPQRGEGTEFDGMTEDPGTQE